MALQQGEKYECGNCGAEIQVTRGPQQEIQNAANAPQCACGQPMQLE